MREIGLDLDNYGYVKDQDANYPLAYNGKYMKLRTEENARLSGNEVYFDPYHNSKQMLMLFSYFSNKIQSEDGRYISVIHTFPGGKIRSGIPTSLSMTDNHNNVYKSKPYNNEAVKYADLICQLNGETDVDLTVYDI
jgi:hypothetical protein